MAEEKPQKSEAKPKGEGKGGGKPDGKPAKGEGKPAKEKDKGKGEAQAAEKPKAPAAPPRPPADPRLKVLKRFHGKFLPRGPLRDRHKALMTRWNSGEDHGGVTFDELKKLYDDWKSTRAKKSPAPQA